MSDARFASLKTDPRFRRLKNRQSKVVLDDRFKDLLVNDEEGKKKRKSVKPKHAKVDKYGRTLSETQDKDDLRRFYRLEVDEKVDSTNEQDILDYARGAVLMESSDDDEEDDDEPPHIPLADEDDSDDGGFVSLGVVPKKVHDENEVEIDLDENTIATLDAQVAEYAKTVRDETANVEQTRRLAVVNLDWDYVRAVHLFKIFSSLVPPGRILSVRVYPSEFGKKRMAKEEKEGPPAELFYKKNRKVEDEVIDEKTIFETGSEADYDEDALRKYQLERLRYYYAIVECDTVETATHAYNELEGTELERSANVFDLSFVPEDMTFDGEPRDQATQTSDTPYKAVEFVTDALRHSKVRLTWDEDDPERTNLLRRPLTKKEIDEADFRAYIASSSSSEGSEDESGGGDGDKIRHDKGSKMSEREKLRNVLLGGNDEGLPEGWGDAFDNKANRGGKSKIGGEEDGNVDMEVTFMPALSQTKNPEDENTLERYQRKMKEKKKKVEAKKRTDVVEKASTKKNSKSSLDDEFFGIESDNQYEEQEQEEAPTKRSRGKSEKHVEPSKAELALLAKSDNLLCEPAHFDMKAVLKAEKRTKSKRKSRKRDDDVDDGPGETQDDFVINVKDDRFAAIHEDHQFAIDPTNPQFKKSKSMAALLDEGSKRRKNNSQSNHYIQSQTHTQRNDRSLQNLVESVKRKSTTVYHGELGKRRKL